MKSFENSTNTVNSEQHPRVTDVSDIYQFPEPVLSFDNADIKLQMIEQIESKLLLSPNDKLYQLMLDVYRRSGELEQAAQVAKQWAKFSPSNQLAVYHDKLFNQKELISRVYNKNEIQPAPFMICDQFLDDSQRDYFWERALNSVEDFTDSGVSYGNGEKVDYQFQNRSSKVLFLRRNEKQSFRNRVRELSDKLFNHLLIPKKTIKNIEVKLTAYGDGGFFRVHQDGFFKQRNSSRVISWVYYFHASPKPYDGGDLVLFDSNCIKENHLFRQSHYTRYKPVDNQIVFFPSWFYHGVTPVKLLKPGFGSCRFAVMGHVSY
ncbi:MAG: 2OG-Fe(II) oxygenase [Kangiellaceae bacterium]|nr:2OG-Fe(II) oxygenase [Kangiellaceae bacterium]MCW8998795.1 2OG-Fe(II) oxygenase [Kangiellaceae bacterium]MCW9016150.1 2OG-Fe(II) oxygenase [Kangiellaceae bacterium]